MIVCIIHSPSSELLLKYFLSKDPTASCLADVTLGNDKHEITMSDIFRASSYTKSGLNVSGIWCITSRKVQSLQPGTELCKYCNPTDQGFTKNEFMGYNMLVTYRNTDEETVHNTSS